MIAGQGDLAGADEVEVVVLVEVVDLVGVLAEEARALHDLGTHERRHDHGREPGGERLVEREVHERDLEARATPVRK